MRILRCPILYNFEKSFDGRTLKVGRLGRRCGAPTIFRECPILHRYLPCVSVAFETEPESGQGLEALDTEEVLLLEVTMLWTILIILLVLWLLGLLGGVGGSLIHLLLVIAAIVLVFNLISGRRKVI